MSRTDKDRPYRVRAADPHQPGRYARHASYRYYWQGSSCMGADCDLPDFHDRRPTATWHQRNTGVPSPDCTWELEHWVTSPYGGSSPKWFTDHVWHNPERRRERDELRAARREYNAHGDLEGFDFANFQGRHSATWNWE